jgi:hypothetical protein
MTTPPIFIQDYYKDGRRLFPNTNPESYLNSGLILNKIQPEPATNFIGSKMIRPEPFIDMSSQNIHKNWSGPFIPSFKRYMVQKQFNPNSA